VYVYWQPPFHSKKKKRKKESVNKSVQLKNTHFSLVTSVFPSGKEAHRLWAVTVEAMRVVYGRVNYHRNELDQRLCVAAISHIESDTCGGAEPCWDRRTVPWEMDIRRQQGVPRCDTNARHSLTEVGDPYFRLLELINILAGSNGISTASNRIWLFATKYCDYSRRNGKLYSAPK